MAVLGGACAHARGVEAVAVRAGAQCGGPGQGPSARWIASESALREAIAAEGPLGMTTPTSPTPTSPTQSPSNVDFARQGVVLVAMGQKPTAGYGLALATPQVEVKDGTATVRVRFDEPPPGAMLAQVLTSPCLLVALPREGLREVRVVSPAGDVRAIAPIVR